MRCARTLFLLHLALGGLAVGLVVAGATLVISGLEPGLPSPAEISSACGNWLSAGGSAALLGFGLLALAGAVLFFSLRSARRQVRAGRAYVARLPLGPEITTQGARCHIVELAQPVAFCAGYWRPRIFLSRGALERLTATELCAVLAHEMHHVRRRDPLRRLSARALADGLFFLPLLSRTADRHTSLGELEADETAVNRVGRPGPLAAALLKFSEREPAPAGVVGIDPERVDRLIGDPEAGRWRLPPFLFAGSALGLAAVGGTVLLLAHGVVSSDVELPLLLAAGCMVVMVGGPILLAGSALLASKRALDARRA